MSQHLTVTLKLFRRERAISTFLEICGILHDEVAGKKTIKNMIKTFKDLKVDPDGFVTVNLVCMDAVGNCADHTYRFKVTETAPKRGSNIGYYNQSHYMPQETLQAPTPAVAKSSKRHWWWLGAGAGCGLLSGLGLWTWRRKPTTV